MFTTDDLPSLGLNLTTLDTFDATPLDVWPWATGVTAVVRSPIYPNRFAYVLKANMKAGASVIHVIDRILHPYNPYLGAAANSHVSATAPVELFI